MLGRLTDHTLFKARLIPLSYGEQESGGTANRFQMAGPHPISYLSNKTSFANHTSVILVTRQWDETLCRPGNIWSNDQQSHLALT